jgi:hypothetical protein
MKKTSLFILILSVVTLPSVSQATKGFGGLGFFYPGYQGIMPKSLAAILPDSYPEAGFRPIMQSGGGYVVFYNIMFGAEGGDYTGGTFTRNGRQLDLTGEFGGFKLGYIVFHKEGWMVYPFAIYGNSSMDLFIHQTPDEQSFDNILANPSLSTRLSYETSVVSLGAGLTYPLFGSQNNDVSSGFMLGLEAGYQMPVSKGAWTYDNGQVLDGPEMSFQGFFVRLVIGGGGISYRAKK